jgi:UrcA family protein
MTASQKWIASFAAAAAVSLLTMSANGAERVGSGRSKTVKTWDLDLAKSEDVQTLNARVRDAAHDVCLAEARRYRGNTRRSAPNGWLERCVDDAVAEAVREVGNRLAMDTTRALY